MSTKTLLIRCAPDTLARTVGDCIIIITIRNNMLKLPAEIRLNGIPLGSTYLYILLYVTGNSNIWIKSTLAVHFG